MAWGSCTELITELLFGHPKATEQLSPVLCTGLRLSWGVQGLQEAAPEPLGGNRQVTVPWEEEVRAQAEQLEESEHEERRMRTGVI